LLANSVTGPLRAMRFASKDWASPSVLRKAGRQKKTRQSAGQEGEARWREPASDVQGMPQRAQRSFLHRFAEGRVGVDGAGDVFQASAHFQ